MKKLIYLLILPLVVVGGIVFANRTSKASAPGTAVPKQLTAAEIKREREKWEASPDGVRYLNWKESPRGVKVMEASAKLQPQIKALTGMEAVVTSLSLPPGSRLGYGLMVSIDGEDYILSFGVEDKTEFSQLRKLKVNDRIILKARAVSHAPKYDYPILSGDYVEQRGNLLYKRIPKKGGC